MTDQTNISRLWRRVPADQMAICLEDRGIPVPVGDIAKSLGIKVLSADLPTNISGMIQEFSTGEIIVKINRHENKERQRYTLAHEIGHFLLHREYLSEGISDSILYRSKLSNAQEAEANKIAADILMPVSKLRLDCTTSPSNIGEDEISSLAKKYAVSHVAMGFRLEGYRTWT